ncbi:MAG: hypothetical protein Q8M02_15110 [Candidatus Didemnitutus sp.]|nr:hypothetical protein [Candidatus Didemnitutus sp.]
MKTLRIVLISLVAVASASASFAGPGIQYWNARRDAQQAKKSAPAAVSAEKSGAACDTMIVKQGKRTSTVKCDASVADTAKCKAACGS